MIAWLEAAPRRVLAGVAAVGVGMLAFGGGRCCRMPIMTIMRTMGFGSYPLVRA